jgi:hypothetical protein
MIASKGSLLASAVATLFVSAGCSSNESKELSVSANQAQSVKCVGINACKGTSECQSVDGANACQGHNSCKGQGWVTIPSLDECHQKGGKSFAEAQGATGAQGPKKS